MRKGQNYFSLLLFLQVFIIAIDLSKCDMNITLANGYDKNEPPENTTGGPLTIQFRLMNNIRINEVNVDHLTIHLNMDVFLRWPDNRLIIPGQQEKKNSDFFIHYNINEQLLEMRQTISVHLLCSEMNFSLRDKCKCKKPKYINQDWI